jgi:proteasome accessory factor C
MNPTARDIERLQLILATLRRAGGRMKVGDLAARVGLSRTDLADAVARLQMVHGDDQRGYEFVDIDIDGDTVDLSPNLDQGLGRRPLPLTPSEFAALAVAVRAACAGPAALLGREASDILAKVLPHVAHAGSGAPSPEAVALEAPTAEDGRRGDVAAAVKAGEELEIEYWSASRDEVTRRPVAPLGLVHRDGNWYLDAICLLRGDERRFRMDRIVACRRTGRKAAPPPALPGQTARRPDPRPRAEPPVAVVRFAPRVAPWVRERYEPAAMTTLPDGGVDVRIPYDSQVFLAGWVLSFAGAATVVEPPSLRDEIRRRLSRSFGRPVN